jgi:6-phosphogluconolactonase (cycloisomerase 2 family)
MLKRVAALFVVCASVAPWIGCGTTTGHYLYAALPSASQFAAFREDPNSGILTLLSFSPVTAGPGVRAVVVHPSKKFLYAANAGEIPTGDISLYSVSTSGVLTELGSRAQAGTTPSLLAIDAAGSFLYVGNTGSEDISVFSIDATTGNLAAVPQFGGAPTARLGIAPLNMALAPSGNFLYVTGGGVPNGVIEIFSISAGVLTFENIAQPGANPFGLAIDPSGTYLYTANFGDNTISEYTIASDGTGGLTEILGSPLGQGFSSPVALLIDKGGKFLFIANQGSANISAYTIGSGGALQVLSNSPFATTTNPSVIATDVKGNYLFVGNQQSPSIESFSLDTSNGTLTQVATYSVGSATTAIAVSP